jgi:hypothetical protein
MQSTRTHRRLLHVLAGAVIAIGLWGCGGGDGGGAQGFGPPPAPIEFSVLQGSQSAPKTVTVTLPEITGTSYLVVESGPYVQATATLALDGAQVTVSVVGGGSGVQQTYVDLRLCAEPACLAVRATVRVPVRIDVQAAVVILVIGGRLDMRAGFGVGGPDSVLPVAVPNLPGRLTVEVNAVEGGPLTSWLAAELIDRRELRLRLVNADRLDKGAYNGAVRVKFQPDDPARPASEDRIPVDLKVADAGCRTNEIVAGAVLRIDSRAGRFADDLVRLPVQCFGAREIDASVTTNLSWLQARVAPATIGDGHDVAFRLVREPVAALPNLSRYLFSAVVGAPGLPSYNLNFDVMLDFSEIVSVTPSAIAANTPAEVTLRGNALNAVANDPSWLIANGLNVRSQRLSCTTQGTGQCDVILELAGMPAGVYPMRVRNELGVNRPGVVLTVNP